MSTHSSILVWKIPWTEETVGLSPWSHKDQRLGWEGDQEGVSLSGALAKGLPHHCVTWDSYCRPHHSRQGCLCLRPTSASWQTHCSTSAWGLSLMVRVLDFELERFGLSISGDSRVSHEEEQSSELFNNWLQVHRGHASPSALEPGSSELKAKALGSTMSLENKIMRFDLCLPQRQQ